MGHIGPASDLEHIIACRNIGPGQNFQKSVVQAIRSARLMLLVGNVSDGTEISYHVPAHFEGKTASGTRVELRPCDFTALEQ
jgi:hypothetical protein